jgi:DNA mismatch repair protein PMS2
MSSAASASEIRPIEAESVRRIVAGQAVTDLASAVKELVDNALDAGSKSINSKLKVLHLILQV